MEPKVPSIGMGKERQSNFTSLICFVPSPIEARDRRSRAIYNKYLLYTYLYNNTLIFSPPFSGIFIYTGTSFPLYINITSNILPQSLQGLLGSSSPLRGSEGSEYPEGTMAWSCFSGFEMVENWAFLYCRWLQIPFAMLTINRARTLTMSAHLRTMTHYRTEKMGIFTRFVFNYE